MFPAVATVYGLRAEEAVNSQFLATLAIDQPLTSSVCPAHTMVKTEEKPVVQDIISNMQVSDPVTQAVIDNVAGKLPLKKEPVRCEVCNLSLSGPSVYDIHITGVKHKKKLALLGQGQPMVAPLGNAPITVSVKEKAAPPAHGISCTVCGIWVDTAEQLKCHEAGKQHKRKLAGGSAINAASNGTKTDDKSNASNKPIGPEKPLPDYVSKTLEGTVTLYTCTLCNKGSNSMEQLNIHLTARTHHNKIKGVFGTRHAPYDKKKSIARATFNSFRSGGVLGQDRQPRPAVSYPQGPVSYPNYNASRNTDAGQYGFSDKPKGYPKNNTSTGGYNATGYEYPTKQNNARNQQSFDKGFKTPGNQYNGGYGRGNGQDSGDYGQATGSYGQATGSYGQASGSYSQASGSLGQTTGSYGQATGSYGQASRSHGQTSGSYGQASGSFGQASGSYGQASRSHGQTSGSYGQASGSYGQTPRYGQAAGYGIDSSSDFNNYGFSTPAAGGQYGSNAKGGKTALFASRNQGYYNHDRITPSKAKHYFNTSISQSQPAYQTQSVQYMHLLDL